MKPIKGSIGNICERNKMLPIIASIVSSLISNNLPGVAQKVLDNGLEFVEEKLGMKLKPDMSPEEIQKVSEAAMKHEEFIISEGYKDIADARDMQKEALKQDDVWSKRFIYIFAGIWSLFAMVFIFAITFGQVPETSIRFADTILGFLLGTVIATILQFFFGSSVTSRKRTDELVDGLKNATNARVAN